MDANYGIVMTTFADEESAAGVLDGLLERRLAACIQTLPIQSAYRWKSGVNREPEVLALIKTRTDRWPELEAFLRDRHPYENPEILLLPAMGGASAYLNWIDAETRPPEPG